MRKYLVDFLGIFNKEQEYPYSSTMPREPTLKEIEDHAIERYKQKNAPLGAFTTLELETWLKHSTTKKMVRAFKNLRLGISNGIAQGAGTKDTLPVMIGKCQGIEEIISIMEDVQGDERKEHVEEILSLYLFNIFNEEK